MVTTSFHTGHRVRLGLLETFGSFVRSVKIVVVIFLAAGFCRARADDASKLPVAHPAALTDDMFDDDDDFDFPPDFPGMGGGAAAPHGLPPGVSHPAPNGGAPFGGGYAPSTVDPGAVSPWSQSTTTSAKKFRFKIVEGEFWEKGKKRTRGAQTYVSPGADGSPGIGGGS